MPSVSEQGTDRPSAHFWRGKRILIVSPEAWGQVRLSKHHYATALMECGAEVFFLGPDLEGMELPGIAQRQGPNAPVLVWRRRPMRGIRFMPRPVRAKMEARQMETLAAISGGPFDILWNFDLHRFRSLTDRTGATLRIVHTMDLRRPRDLREPVEHADLPIVVSPRMAAAMGRDRDRPLVLTHAWMPRQQEAVALPALSPDTKVGYLGNLAIPFIDWGGVIAMAKEHPAVQFYLMGPTRGAFGDRTAIDPGVERRLQSLPNIHLPGLIPYNQVPGWLEAMDLLIVPYDSARYADATAHPHKLLEYLASGKAVLSSHLQDHAELHELVVMAAPGASIATQFQKVFDQLDQLNSPVLQAERRAYASRNTYAQRIAVIADVLCTRAGG